MSEQNQSKEKPEMASEPDVLARTEISRIKTSIIQTIQQSEDEALLQEIYKILQTVNTHQKPLNIARHIGDVFA